MDMSMDDAGGSPSPAAGDPPPTPTPSEFMELLRSVLGDRYRLAQVLGYHWTRHPDRLAALQRIPAAAWDDADAVLATTFSITRADLLAHVLAPEQARQRGWMERFLHWLFVGEQA